MKLLLIFFFIGTAVQTLYAKRYFKIFLKDGSVKVCTHRNYSPTGIKLKEQTILPKHTDSIKTNGPVGHPYQDQWIFKIVEGPIALYSVYPWYRRAKYVYFQELDGPLQPYSREGLGEIVKKEIKDINLLDSPASLVIRYNNSVTGGSAKFDSTTWKLKYPDRKLVYFISDNAMARIHSNYPNKAISIYNGIPFKYNYNVNIKLMNIFYGFTRSDKKTAYPAQLASLRYRLAGRTLAQIEPIFVFGFQQGYGAGIGLMALNSPESFKGFGLGIKANFIKINKWGVENEFHVQTFYNLSAGERLFYGLGISGGRGIRQIVIKEDLAGDLAITKVVNSFPDIELHFDLGVNY